jgi:hypothetical protein
MPSPQVEVARDTAARPLAPPQPTPAHPPAPSALALLQIGFPTAHDSAPVDKPVTDGPANTERPPNRQREK